MPSAGAVRTIGAVCAVVFLRLTNAPLAPVISSFEDTFEVIDTVASPSPLFCAVTAQVVDPRTGIVVGSQDWANVTSPCLLKNATGRCSAGEAFDVRLI